MFQMIRQMQSSAKEAGTAADLQAKVREEFWISIAPLFEQHEQHSVERAIFWWDRVVDEVYDVLQTLWRNPDEETASSADVVSCRLDEVVGKCPVTVSSELQRSLDKSFASIHAVINSIS